MHRELARAFHWIDLRSGHALRSARKMRKPRILMYHAIGDKDTPGDLFVWQIKVLRAEFEIVSLPELLDRMDTGNCAGDEIALTFDDGVRNHVTAAYPLLSGLGVPATFFVCPGLMDSGRWIWNMELRFRLKLLTEAERARLARALGAASPEVEALIRWSKRLAISDREQAEARVRASTREFDPRAEQLDRYAPMTWDQAMSLDPAIVTLGSHTVSHPILPTLTAERQRTEIAGSRSLIEQRIGRKAELFCYPNGDHDESTVGLVRDCYRAAVTSRADLVGPEPDMHQLPRIPAGERAGLFMRRLYHPGA